MGFFADGKVTGLFGTHTHVQTADECLLPHGTGYITDVGMTGVIDSVLGVKPEIIIGKLRTKMPARFDWAKGPSKMDCVLFSADRCGADLPDVTPAGPPLWHGAESPGPSFYKAFAEIPLQRLYF